MKPSQFLHRAGFTVDIDTLLGQKKHLLPELNSAHKYEPPIGWVGSCS